MTRSWSAKRRDEGMREVENVVKINSVPVGPNRAGPPPHGPYISTWRFIS